MIWDSRIENNKIAPGFENNKISETPNVGKRLGNYSYLPFEKAFPIHPAIDFGHGILRYNRKSFQRRYRQKLINGKIDRECLIIAEKLSKLY